MTAQKILVTGGAQGIGAATCSHLNSLGHHIVMLDVLTPSPDFSGDFYQVDFSDLKASKAVLADVARDHRISAVVNNVGIVKPAILEETSEDDLDIIMDVNVRSALLAVKACLPAMKALGLGRIVNITSRVILGKELRTAYSASKGALTAMTRTWALELAKHGITVNAVAPGPIGTDAFYRNNPPDSPQTRAIIDRVPLGRMGNGKDIANAVSFFLSEESGFITGQTLYVCGGVTVGLAS